jgi:hypothetical protein
MRRTLAEAARGHSVEHCKCEAPGPAPPERRTGPRTATARPPCPLPARGRAVVEAVWVIVARCRRSAKGRAARFALGDRTRAAFRARGSARTHARERRRRMRLRAHSDAAAARCRRGLGNASTDKDAQWAARVTGNIAPRGPRVRLSCVQAPSLSARASFRAGGGEQ